MNELGWKSHLKNICLFILFRKIQIGMNCAFSDEIFDSILQKNKFQFLEVILFYFTFTSEEKNKFKMYL